RPITIKVDNIPLKSALNLILRDAKLTYVVQDDVVRVTTERYAHGKLVTKVYQVTDLVTPIQNATMPDVSTPRTGLRASQMGQPASSFASQGAVQPYPPPFGLNNGQSVGTANSQSGSMAQSLNAPQRSESVEISGRMGGLQGELINLIKS